MKKLFLPLCLLYAVNSYAMQRAAALTFAWSPVALPGAYYAYKTHQDQQTVERDMKQDPKNSPEDIAIEKRSVSSFPDYIDGALEGMAPGINILRLFDKQLENTRSITVMREPEKVGFYGGVSLYATLPMAFIYIRRMK